MLRTFTVGLFALWASAFTSLSAGQERPDVFLQEKGEAVQLIVGGEPFLILGGETSNSIGSHPGALDPHWETFEALNLNTLLVPVYWEVVEPQEGRFDFVTVDRLIADARAHDMKLVLLWFGTWKNSMSTYVPGWMKRDGERFPRARDEARAAQDILSPYGEATLAADKAAFTALMAHLARSDPEAGTVIMVQVENEMGMLPSARDHSAPANAAWSDAVPAVLLDRLKAEGARFNERAFGLWEAQGRPDAGTWAEVFGESAEAEEVFTAWGLARFANAVAVAGKAEHDIPVFVNAALNRPGVAPGSYPSGGPLAHLIGIWKTAAPDLDFLAPDIYDQNFTTRIAAFDTPGNAVFIPEANRAGRAEAPADALWAIGELDAIGFSPFSIDTIDPDEIAPLAETYQLIADLRPLIVEAQGTGRLAGLRPDIAADGSMMTDGEIIRMGGYEMTATFLDPWTAASDRRPETSGALIIETGENEFLIAGKGVTLTFAPSDEAEGFVGIEWARAGSYEDGIWQPGLWLNGDQTHQGRHIRLPPGNVSVQCFRLYTYR